MGTHMEDWYCRQSFSMLHYGTSPEDRSLCQTVVLDVSMLISTSVLHSSHSIGFLSVWWVVKSHRKDCICRSSFVWIYQNHRRKGFFLPGQGSQCSGFGSSGLSKLFLYFIYLLWSSMKTFVLKRQGRTFCLWLGFRTLLGLYFSLLQIVWLGNWKW